VKQIQHTVSVENLAQLRKLELEYRHCTDIGSMMTAFTRISVADAHALIEAGPVTIADIRDEQTFNSGFITNAQRIDNTNLQDFIDDSDLDQPLLVVCYHGNSSQPAAEFLADRGFDQVYSLDGGFTEWAATYPEKCTSSGA
jgi:thiosulfate sulfurtransferase